MCKNSDHGPTGVGTGTLPAAVRTLVPNHPACTDALALAKSSLPASILYHSLRVYFYAQAFMGTYLETQPDDATWTKEYPGPGATSDSPRPPHITPPAPPYVLFVACILHDIGVAKDYDTVPDRFEIASADVAAGLLRKHHVPEPLVKDAWLAMSLHTSPGIAERLGGMVRALRLAVRADFGSFPQPDAHKIPGGQEGFNVIRWQLPRLEIEKELGDAVVNQALAPQALAIGEWKHSQKAPKGSWPGDLVRGKKQNPGWEGVNKEF